MLLELNGLDVECIIGELPDERERVFGTTADRAFERFQVGIIQEFRHAGPPCALLQRVHVP